MNQRNLPDLRIPAWSRLPPEPLDAPGLYEGVALRRILAYGIDVCCLGLIALVAWVVFWLLNIISFGLLIPITLLAAMLLPIAYHTYFLGARRATPGMALLDLELRRWDGGPADYFQAFVQTALFFFTVYPTFWLVLLVALFNERRRTLHDLIAGTVIIRAGALASGHDT
jgi:uncharacterized RDD family membrane protein YckC